MTMNGDCYDLDNVRQVLKESGLRKETISFYLSIWERWLAWCGEHSLQPGAARSADVDRFTSTSIKTARNQLSHIYSKIGTGERNPAQRLAPLTLHGREEQRRRWAQWVSWCELFSASPLPADPVNLASYLEEAGNKVSVDVARRALNVICRTHVEDDLPNPRRWPEVIAVMEALKHQEAQGALVPTKCSVLSTGTVELRQRHWQHWSEWCAAQSVDPMVANSDDVVTYLKGKAKFLRVPTIKTIAYCLKIAYQAAGDGHNPVDSDEVRNAVHGISRNYTPPVNEVSGAEPPGDEAGLPGRIT